MPEGNYTVYTLLISCPSDVTPFVPVIEDAVYRFNRICGKKDKIIVLPSYYQNSAYPTMGDHVQTILNTQLLDSADMIVSVFWTRFGNPTTHHDSGTEEEIAYMRDKSKQVFLYFLNKPILPTQIEPQQYMRLLTFKQNIHQQGFHRDATDEKDLGNQFYDHLKLYFDQLRIAPKLKNSPHKKRILWVDDRPENNVFVRRYFEQYGIDTIIALSTDQALHYYRSMDTISVIISDMGRKEGPHEGYVLLEEIRKIDPDVPYFIHAGSNNPKYHEMALDRGAQGSTGDIYELISWVTATLLKA